MISIILVLLVMAIALSTLGAALVCVAWKYEKALYQRNVMYRAYNAQYGLYEAIPEETAKVLDEIEKK